MKIVFLPRHLKTTLKQQDWGGFLLNFLAVVLGIAITVSVDSYLNGRKERNDVNSALQLVVNELKDNLSELDEADQYAQKEAKAVNYLMRYYGKYDTCDPDSLTEYCNLPVSLHKPQLSEDALELLKTSSLFQKVPDINVSLGIIHAYKIMQGETILIDYNNQRKEKLIDSALTPKVKEIFSSSDLTAAKMWGAITSSVDGRHFLHEVAISLYFGVGHEEVKKDVEETIRQIEDMIARNQ